MSWLLAGFTALALAAALTLLGLSAGQLHAAQLGFEVILAAAILLYAGTGRLIAGRVPGNAIGWLLALTGLLLAGELLTEQYAVYGLVTGVLVGVYAGLVLLATRVLPLHTLVAVAGSTLVAAALFSPLRRWVQLKVDRRFNRARYDADQMVAAFAGRLKDTVNLDSVRDDLATVVHQALEPTLMSVWINET
jgi:hypothetical protein